MKEQIQEKHALSESIYMSGHGLDWKDSDDIAEQLYTEGYRKQKHGTWYHGTENGAVYAKCSACGRKMNYSCYGYAYCSLCGARMDGAKTKGGEE